MRGVFHDVRFAVRSFVRSPGWTASVVLILAFALGASTAIFSAVDAVLLKELPFGDPGRLVVLWAGPRGSEPSTQPVSEADFFDWQAASRSFSGLAAYHPWSFNLTGGGDPERLQGAVATANFFALLGRPPILGRGFTADEDRPGGPAVVLLGHGLWQRRFGGDRTVIGRRLNLDGTPSTVVGVLPPGFDFPNQAEVWRPLAVAAGGAGGADRELGYLRVIGRLAPGATLDGARREMAALGAELARRHPASNATRSVALTSLGEQTLGKVEAPMKSLFWGVLLLLVAAAANVGHLLLARTLARQGELALRQAVGAGRGRLARQLLTEMGLLALAGGVVALPVALLGARLLAGAGPRDVPRLDQAHLDGRSLAFAAVATLAAALLAGLAPALFFARDDGGARRLRQERGGGARVFAPLVSLEVAIAFTLLVGGGLLAASFLRLARVEPGFVPQSLLTFQLSLPEDAYGDPARVAAFHREVRDRLGAVPGVVSVATALSLPVGGGMNVQEAFTVEGEKPPAPGEEPRAFLRPVSPSYFATLRLPVLSGRGFLPADAGGAAPVALVNQTLAARAFPGGSALGRRLTTGTDLEGPGKLDSVPREIVGIVADVKHAGLARPTAPEIYVSTEQSTWRFMNVVVRTRGEPAASTRPLLAALWQIDANLPVARVRTLDEILAASVGAPRFYAGLAGALAGVALLLAALGIHGIVAFFAERNRRQIGVRLALGARRGQVLGWVLARAGGWTALGLAAGVALALWLRRLLASFLFEIDPSSPWALLAAALGVAVTAFAAGAGPAWRASRVDPAAELRVE